LASTPLQPDNQPSKDVCLDLELKEGAIKCPQESLSFDSSVEVLDSSADEYVMLQQRIFKLTAVLSTLTVGITAVSFGLKASISLLLGAISGVLYLRLLARNIGTLGKSSKSVSKTQLLVPVVLVLVVSKVPHLDLLPALLGFLIYKLSLSIQMVIDSRFQSSSD